MRTLRRMVALGVTTAVLGGIAVASDAAAPDAPAPPPPAVPHEHGAIPVATPDRDQLSLLGVLRRDRSASDTVPDRTREHVDGALGPDVGANAALARRALRTPLGEDLYVVPGRGWVCLASSDGTASCTPTDRLETGYAVSLQRVPSGFRLGGLVPDGVTQVQLRGTDGQTADVTTEGNAWRGDVPFEPVTVAWTHEGSATEVTVPVYAPPPAPTAPAAQ